MGASEMASRITRLKSATSQVILFVFLLILFSFGCVVGLFLFLTNRNVKMIVNG